MQPLKKYSPTILIAIVTLFASLFSAAQTSYNDYSSDSEKIILNEQFNSNQNKWYLVENKTKIEDGMLVINGAVPELLVHINENKDYEIEILILSERKRVSIYFDKIRWAISDNDFLLNANVATSFIKKNIEPPFDIKKFNKYTIRKIGSKFHFFINEIYVSEATTDYIKFLQKDYSISFPSSQTIDYLKVSYLIKKENREDNNEKTVQPDKTIPEKTVPKTKGLEPEKQEGTHGIKRGGKYYALIVGVSKYDEPKLNLDKPEKDAEKIKEIFLKRYSFTDSTTFLLQNPTRQKIISELYRLRKIIGANDNLLIFYAGHGFWDEEARQGYWWAKDAIPDDPSTWLSNSDLREQIRSIKSAHTLLISDACFSGGIFKTRSGNEIQNATRDIQLLYSMPSRRAITSGTMTAVPDNSIFLEYFSKRLNDNQNKFLSSQQLFDSFRTAVINNSNVVPQDGVIADTGDEGGDFIFILKEN